MEAMMPPSIAFLRSIAWAYGMVAFVVFKLSSESGELRFDQRWKWSTSDASLDDMDRLETEFSDAIVTCVTNNIDLIMPFERAFNLRKWDETLWLEIIGSEKVQSQGYAVVALTVARNREEATRRSAVIQAAFD